MDALRADFVGHLGGDAGATPTLDRLAAEGVTFGAHQSVAPSTSPSTKALFTGRHFPRKGHEKLPAEGPETLAELFRRAGYRTGAFTGNGNISHRAGNTRGFEAFARAPVDSAAARRPYNDDAERIHSAALHWLDALPPNERVFLYLHSLHPHLPYDPPEPFRSRFVESSASTVDGSRETLKRLTEEGPAAASPADRARLRQLYTGSVAYNDAQLAVLLDSLETRFAGREMLLILTSDHGEEFYEHRGLRHGFTLYREQLEIPLVFWWPQRLGPGRIDHVATDSVDLHHTLRALLGMPAAQTLVEPRPLWDLLLGHERSRPWRMRFASKSGQGSYHHMVQSERYKLIWAPGDGRLPGMGRGAARDYDLEYFFDLVDDPQEMNNLAGEPLIEAAWLRTRLRGWLERSQRLEVGEEMGEIDEETRHILEALGYLD